MNLGLQIVPYGPDGVLFLGGETDVVMRGDALRQMLGQLLPFLDGERDLESIASNAQALGWQREDVALLLGNLFFNGLLEEGPERPDEPSPSCDFLGRFCDVTRLNENRYGIINRLRCRTFALFGPEQAAQRVANDLREAGAAVVICREARHMPAESAFCIGIHTRDADPSTFFDASRRKGNDALYLGFGSGVWQLGPMLIPGHSLGYHDWEMQSATLGQAEDTNDLALAMAAQSALCIASGVVSAALDRYMRFDGSRETTHFLARTRAASPHAQDVMEYLTAVSQPPRRYLPPKSYQSHYQESNVKLPTEPLPRLAGSEAVPLPMPHLPVQAEQPACGKSLSIGLLALILKMAFGHHSEGERTGTRIAPTGGNLNSPVAFLIVRDVPGLAPGRYRYNGFDHALERVAGALDLPTRVLEPAPGAQAYLAVFGDLAKVRSKYGTYALSIVGYDGGVATQYVRDIGACVGLASRELPFVDGGLLAASLGLPGLDVSLAFVEALALGRTRAAPPATAVERLVRRANFPLSANGLLDSPSTAPEQPHSTTDLAALLKMMRSRRSVRAFSSQPVPKHALSSLCQKAQTHLNARLTVLDPTLGGRIYVVAGDAVEGLAPGIYRVELSIGGLAEFKAEQPLQGQGEVEQLTNQRNVGLAPVLIVPVVALENIAVRLGARGFMLTLAIAGAVVGRIWLDALEAGLVGLAYGGLLESELRVRTPSLDRSGLALLTFALGVELAPQGGGRSTNFGSAVDRLNAHAGLVARN